MSTRVLLLRHASHDLAGRALAGRMPGLGLNAAGHAQAARLADWARGASIDAIHVTPQPRTRQTAEPLAEALQLPLQVAPEFDEIEFGEWAGRSFQELHQTDAQRWRQWCDQRSQATPPGGEPFVQVAQRVQAGLSRLLREHPGQQVLVVSHADVIKAAIATQLGLSLDALERFEIGCGSLSALEVGEGWSKLVLLNWAPAG